MKMVAALVAALAFVSAGCGGGKGGSSPAPPAPALQLSSGTLAFEATTGGASPAAQSVTVTNAGGGALAPPSAAVQYGEGSGWLASVEVSGSASPFTIAVQPTAGALAAGTYHASIVVASAGASNTPQAIAVTLVVTDPPPSPVVDPIASMSLTTQTLSFGTMVATGPDPAPATVKVSPYGTGVLPAPETTIAYVDGSGWLSASLAGASPPYTLTATPSRAGLAPGAYRATISLAVPGAPNSPQKIAVTLTVRPDPVLTLSASAVEFFATAGGPAPTPQYVTAGVAALSLGTSTATVDYGSGPTGWLTVTPATSFGTPVSLKIQPSIAGLAAGTYQATVGIASTYAAASAALPVTLTVAEPTGATLSISATKLTFTTRQGSDPQAQTVTVSRGGTGTFGTPFGSIVYSSTNGSGWLTATVSGSAPPYTLTLQPSAAGLAPGLYRADVNVVSPGAANSPQAVTAVLWVTRPVTVTRTCTAWAEDGTTAASPCGDVWAIDSTFFAAAGESFHSQFTAGAPGTWYGETPESGAYHLIVSWSGASATSIWASAASLDLGIDRSGRPYADIPYATTVATLGLTGLQPWDPARDGLLLTSWDAGLVDLEAPVLASGAKTGSVAVDFAAKGLNLLAAGDDLGAIQLRAAPTPLAGATFRTTAGAARGAGVAMSSGVPVAIGLGPFAAPTSAGSLAASWRHSQFEAGLPPLDGAIPPVHTLGVLAVPVPLGLPSPFRNGAATQLLDLTMDGTSPVPDTDYGTLSYGRFLPARYREYRYAGYVGTVARAAPGAAPAQLLEYVVRYDDAASAPVPVIPLVTGARSPRINFRDALVPLAGVGTSAFLSWTRPALGEPTSFRVTLYDLVNVGGQTVPQFVGDMVNASSGFGGLTAGHVYVLGIQLVSSPGDDSTGASPWREGVPLGASLVYTNTFSP